MRERTQVAVPNQNPVDLYPPRTARAGEPLTFVLHGREMDPTDMCERWSEAGRAEAWLACPAGNTQASDTFDWGGSASDRLEALDAQLSAIDALLGDERAHDADDVIVGFSRGAFLARDLVEARPGRFHGMILFGAALTLAPSRLRDGGVRRVVLGSGDKDEARASMRRTADKLAAAGIATRFVSLGPIYHALPDDLGPVMRDALAWVRGD